MQKNIQPHIIEIHNRPIYIKDLIGVNSKVVLYFHNDPLSMSGSKSVDERIFLLHKCSKIIFNSEWSKNQFLFKLNLFYKKSEKLEVIHQSINRKKVIIKEKENIITFVGKLNSAKGYDIFADAIVKILNKYKKWNAIVIGDEPREKIIAEHKNLNKLGFLKHKNVLKILKNQVLQ